MVRTDHRKASRARPNCPLTISIRVYREFRDSGGVAKNDVTCMSTGIVTDMI